MWGPEAAHTPISTRISPPRRGTMASHSKKTKYRRKLRQANAGRDRKRAARIHGTTPVFPIHTEEADKNAPQQAKPDTTKA